jgi:hypothetical protein
LQRDGHGDLVRETSRPSVAAIASLGLLAIPAGSSGEPRYGIPLDRVYAHD